MLNNFNKVLLVWILLNIILFCIKLIFNKLNNFYNQLSSQIINYYINNNRLILYKICITPINDYKYMLEAALQLLNHIYSNSSMFPSTKEFKFSILFVEVDPKTNLPIVLLSDPYIFNYNVNDPISVNDLFNLIRWNTFTYKNNLNKIVVSIRII